MILRLAAGIMSLNLVSLMVVIWALLVPVELPEIYNEPFPVSPAIVAKGEVLTYTIEYNKTHMMQVDTHKNIICEDGNLVTMAPTHTAAPTGTHRVDIDVTIPEKTSLGVCHIEITNTYHVNALRDENRTMQTQDFTVIERL